MIVYDRNKKPVGMLSTDGGLSVLRNGGQDISDLPEGAESMRVDNSLSVLKNTFLWLFISSLLSVTGYASDFVILKPRTEMIVSPFAFGANLILFVMLTVVWRRAFPVLLFYLAEIGLVILMNSEAVYLTHSETGWLWFVILAVKFSVLVSLRILYVRCLKKHRIKPFRSDEEGGMFELLTFILLVVFILISIASAEGSMEEGMAMFSFKGPLNMDESLLMFTMCFCLIQIAVLLQFFFAYGYMTLVTGAVKKAAEKAEEEA